MKRWIAIALLLPVVVVVVAFLGHELVVAFLGHGLLERAGYRRFVAAAASTGWRILVVAIAVSVADMAAMIIYTIRQGKSDDLKGHVVTENRPMTAMSVGRPLPMGRSKRKILGSKSEFVSMESLLDGSATLGERITVLGIITALVCFFLIFVGAGLMLMKDSPLSLLFPIAPGAILYNVTHFAWKDYQKAKKRAAASRRGERVDAHQFNK